MFTPAPRPPKDYVLNNVTNNLTSSSQFTPESLPRVTQPNLRKYCFPIQYKDDEPGSGVYKPRMHPTIFNNMIEKERAGWVVRPGVNDFLIHDVHTRYAVIEDPRSYDPRYMNKERIFIRSYILELDCLKAGRAEKLRQKCEREHAEFENRFQFLVNRQKQMELPRIRVQSCRHQPPFWWRTESEKKSAVHEEVTEKRFDDEVETKVKMRWAEEPNLTAFVQDDPCKRKQDMLLVGAMFKNEACNFYFNNYPPPNVPFRPKKFS